MKNLAVFGISLALIALVVLLYMLCRNCCRKDSICAKLKVKVAEKLFYSTFIRYIVVGYLKLFNQFATMLCITYLLNGETIGAVFSIPVLVFLTMWPLFTIWFLLRH